MMRELLHTCLLMLAVVSSDVLAQEPARGKPLTTDQEESLLEQAARLKLSAGSIEPGSLLPQAIAALQQKIDMPFQEGFSLRDLHKYLRQETRSESLPEGIPIYFDPKGLADVNQTLASKVSLDTRQVPLATALTKILDPLRLTAFVQRDGVIVITSPGRVRLPSSKDKDGMRYVTAVVTSPGPYQRPRLKDQTAAGWEAAAWKPLDSPCPVPFENETPLEDFIKYFQDVTQGPVWPNGLRIAFEKGPPKDAAIVMNTQGIPLRSSLALALDQFDLTYSVVVPGRTNFENSRPYLRASPKPR